MPLLFCLLLIAAVGLHAEEDAPSAVRDLRYGVMLFEHYRGQPLDALVESAVAVQQGGVRGHGDYPQLMRGAIRLSWGMDRGAYRDFAAVLSDTAQPAVADRAWLYLGKLYLRRGETGKAEQSLARVGASLDDALRDESIYLRASLAVARDDVAGARSLAAGLDEESIWRPYLMLKTAAAERDDPEAALADLTRLLGLPARVEEHYVLQDRARLGAGLLLIEARRPDEAEQLLAAVRQGSPYAEPAMLALGWAAAEGERPEAALAPWLALSGASSASTAQAEARLALPWLYERLQRPGLALQEFDRAAAAYLDQIGAVDAVLAGLDLGWSRHEDPLLALQRRWPELPELTPLAASIEFRQALERNRDLRALERRLLRDRQRAEMLGVGLEVRRARYLQRAASGEDAEQVLRHRQLLEQRETLAAALAAAERAGDGLGLLDAQTKAQWQRIRRAEARLERLQDAGARVPDGAAERLARLRGRILWQAAWDYTDAQWRARRALDAVDAALATAAGRLESLGRQQAVTLPFAETAGRIAALGGSADALLRRATALREASDEELRGQLRAVLEQRRERLERYRQYARLAAARLAEQAAGDAS